MYLLFLWRFYEDFLFSETALKDNIYHVTITSSQLSHRLISAWSGISPHNPK